MSRVRPFWNEMRSAGPESVTFENFVKFWLKYFDGNTVDEAPPPYAFMYGQIRKLGTQLDPHPYAETVFSKFADNVKSKLSDGGKPPSPRGRKGRKHKTAAKFDSGLHGEEMTIKKTKTDASLGDSTTSSKRVRGLFARAATE